MFHQIQNKEKKNLYALEFEAPYIKNDLIRLNKEFNLTIIIVEQNVNFLKKAAYKFSILERGKIVEEGNSTEITNDLVQKYLTV